MLQKIIPNKKMQKSCPEQQFASFGKEVILQKTHPQQKNANFAKQGGLSQQGGQGQ